MPHIKTKDHESWLAERQRGIGGSDIGIILGFSKYKTPLELYKEKTGEVVRSGDDMTAAQEFGHRLEAVVAEKFSDVNGCKVRRERKTRFLSAECKWIRANLDYVIPKASQDILDKFPHNNPPSGPGVLSIKTCSREARKSWGLPYDIGHYAQLQWELLVTGYTWGAIALLEDGRRYDQVLVERDDAFIGKLKDAAEMFWYSVTNGHPPAAQVSDLQQIQPEEFSEVEANEGIVTTIERLKQAKAEARSIKEEIEALEDQVRLFMGENAVLTSAGAVIATYKSVFRKEFKVPAGYSRRLEITRKKKSEEK